MSYQQSEREIKLTTPTDAEARYAEGMAIACNGVAVLNHFHRVALELWRRESVGTDDECASLGTDAWLRHPIVVATVDKLKQLVESAGQDTIDNLSMEAWRRIPTDV